jgi:hypothetical protein
MSIIPVKTDKIMKIIVTQKIEIIKRVQATTTVSFWRLKAVKGLHFTSVCPVSPYPISSFFKWSNLLSIMFPYISFKSILKGYHIYFTSALNKITNIIKMK